MVVIKLADIIKQLRYRCTYAYFDVSIGLRDFEYNIYRGSFVGMYDIEFAEEKNPNPAPAGIELSH